MTLETLPSIVILLEIGDVAATRLRVHDFGHNILKHHAFHIEMVVKSVFNRLLKPPTYIHINNHH